MPFAFILFHVKFDAVSMTLLKVCLLVLAELSQRHGSAFVYKDGMGVLASLTYI